MDLALNNLQRLIYHKTQPTNQLSLPLFPDLLEHSVIVLVRIPSMSEIDLFKNYSYSIGPYAKKRKALKL